MTNVLPFEPSSVRTAPNGMIALWSEGPILYTRVRGHFTREQADQLMKLGNEAMAKHGALESFHDWGDMTGFDLACQTDLTVWSLKERRKMKRLTILVKMPVVMMGVRVANAALKGLIQVCENQSDFNAALSQRVRDQRAS